MKSFSDYSETSEDDIMVYLTIFQHQYNTIEYNKVTYNNRELECPVLTLNRTGIYDMKSWKSSPTQRSLNTTNLVNHI